jgi:hypothetical protein
MFPKTVCLIYAFYSLIFSPKEDLVFAIYCTAATISARTRKRRAGLKVSKQYYLYKTNIDKLYMTGVRDSGAFNRSVTKRDTRKLQHIIGWENYSFVRWRKRFLLKIRFHKSRCQHCLIDFIAITSEDAYVLIYIYIYIYI